MLFLFLLILVNQTISQSLQFLDKGLKGMGNGIRVCGEYLSPEIGRAGGYAGRVPKAATNKFERFGLCVLYVVNEGGRQ